MWISGRTAKQVHPVEDIWISPWPVDLVEFGDGGRCARPQEAGGHNDNYITRCHRRLGAAQPECLRSAAMVKGTLGQYVAVCPRLQFTSHTQETSTLSRIKCERYIFIKKCVRSFMEVRHYVWLCLCMYMSTQYVLPQVSPVHRNFWEFFKTIFQKLLRFFQRILRNFSKNFEKLFKTFWNFFQKIFQKLMRFFSKTFEIFS